MSSFDALLLIAVIALAGVVVLWVRREYNRWHWRRAVASIDDLDWREFEDFVRQLKEHQGYKAYITRRSGDGGADVIAERSIEIQVIEVKHRSNGGVVGTKEIYGVLNATMDLAGVNLADVTDGDGQFEREPGRFVPMVVTNGRFTAQAKRWARRRGVVLVGRAGLGKMIADLDGIKWMEN